MNIYHGGFQSKYCSAITVPQIYLIGYDTATVQSFQFILKRNLSGSVV